MKKPERLLPPDWESIQILDPGLANNPEAQRIFESQARVKISVAGVTVKIERILDGNGNVASDTRIIDGYINLRKKEQQSSKFHLDIIKGSGRIICDKEVDGTRRITECA